PFLNMGGDPEKDYFADGITEDVITELSRWRSLAVTSRNSTFRFKGKSVDMQRLGRELGVRFLVKGSVRRMGERIRITAQLIDAESGNHVWGERFDRPLAELFAVQDQVVHTIVGTLVGRVQASGAERTRRKLPSSLDAYDHVLRGNALPWDDPASAAEAKRAFERAIEIDPGYGLPHSLLAALVGRDWENDLSAPRGPVFCAGLVLARAGHRPIRVAPLRRCLAGFRSRSDEQLAPGARYAGGVLREARAIGTRAGGGGAVPGGPAWRHRRQAGRQDPVQGCRR